LDWTRKIGPRPQCLAKSFFCKFWGEKNHFRLVTRLAVNRKQAQVQILGFVSAECGFLRQLEAGLPGANTCNILQRHE
jgi:hypothetical protein